MAETHSIYALAFMADSVPVIFYVGHTKDHKRRRNEHLTNPFNPNHREYMTMKYRWCRSLRELGIDYDLIVLHEDVLDDDVTEYVKILEIARDNESKGITFYDGLPLTNMKAGDMLSEMLRENVRTYDDVINFCDRQDGTKIAAMVNYERDINSPFASVRAQALDWFGPTPEPQTERARAVKLWLKEYGEKTWRDFEQSILQESLNKNQNQSKYEAMLADPERQARILAETRRLMALDGADLEETDK